MWPKLCERCLHVPAKRDTSSQDLAVPGRVDEQDGRQSLANLLSKKVGAWQKHAASRTLGIHDAHEKLLPVCFMHLGGFNLDIEQLIERNTMQYQFQVISH